VTKSVTKRPKSRRLKCGHCGARFSRPFKGRPAQYCSRNCRQRAYEARRFEGELSARLPGHLLQTDIDTIRSRDEFRQAVVAVLRDVGLLASPPASPRRSRLRIVKPDRADGDREPE
jgi:hypothetical protein